MLETVREFAVEQLDASGEYEAVRGRHAEYFLGLARGVERTYWGDEPGDVRGQVRAEEANLRAAVGWAIAHGDVEMALRLAIVMFHPLSHTGDNSREQFSWLQRALALPGGSPATRAFALTRWAAVVGLDELDQGTALAEEALELARRHNDAFGIAEALRILGNIAIHTGDRARARGCLLEALAGFQELGLRGRAGWTLHHLSALEGVGAEADPTRAAAYCEEALAIFRDLEHVRGVEATLNWHSECAFKLGDLPGALASAQEGLVMVRSDLWSYDSLDRIADVASSIGQPETAARLYGAADELRERAARPIEPAFRAAHEARIDVARQALGEEAFAAIYAAGRALTQRQVEAEALSVSIQPAAAPTISLSPRELEVLRLLAAGLSDRAIAEALFIGERTVNTHVGHIFAKLGVRNRAAAVAAAAGLIDPAAGGADFV
jgi:non-specific serine/threonine protein kinase